MGIAIPSGMGVALGITGNTINPLVGVAISAALLPPIVNSGISISIAFMVFLTDRDNHEIYHEHWRVGMMSFGLFSANWILIFIFGWAMFKVKKLDQDKGNALKAQKMTSWIRKTQEQTRMDDSLKEPFLFKSHSDNLTANDGHSPMLP